MAKDDKKDDAGRSDAPAEEAASEAVSSDKRAEKSTEKAQRKTGVSRGWPLAAIAIGVIGIILAVVLYFRPGLDYANEAYADRETTDEVATAAAENAKSLVAIDYEALDEYVDNLPEIMTSDLEDELMGSWDQLADTYTQAKTKVDVSISDVGVTYLEENRAEVLIAQNVSVTQDGQAAGSTDGTYLVRLEKIDGDWKLSSVPDLPS